ncbi:protein adenylyltransferase SelO [Paenalcaligenes sp. Me131]|uniref:protein adenylyltransferase SelO n=1 Tax=Paenalcaligenes sp. Me131 TaxID=3392636 RepID=UPI003D2E5129
MSILVSTLDDLHVSNGFASSLPETFYTLLQPSGLRDAQLLHANDDLAQRLGLSQALLHSPEMLAVLSGNAPLPGGQSLAAVYSGHQFGVWAGQLGDGRAHLLGAIDGSQGSQELQLKGSGLTPYSRMGDGRAVIRSSVREYLASVAMKGLGIPTTEALAIVTSPVPVYRETVERAAIVTRVAPSFVRFGSFEHWLGHHDEMQSLLHYVVQNFYPALYEQSEDNAELARLLLTEVTQRTAYLMADWLTVGFCHGVMNTDNMSILGLTLDFGPFGFMDAFQANHICNTTDQQGRYAWNQQPSVGHWNLYRLASAMTTLGATPETLNPVLQQYEGWFLERYRENLCRKMGWQEWLEGDTQLVDDWWRLLHRDQADFSLSFRALAWAEKHPEAFLQCFHDQDQARAWVDKYRARVEADPQTSEQRQQSMNAANPLYVLRNYLAQQAIAAAEKGDASVLSDLFTVLSNPFEERSGYERYAEVPPPEAQSIALSCSS